MKSLKNIFAFLLPLLSMLIAFSIYLLINDVVSNYKDRISKDYSIVVVSNTVLNKDNLNKIAGISVDKIIELPNDKIIDNIKTKLSENSINLLKEKLPNFYQVYLEIYPTSSELEEIKNTLLKNPDIKNVEIFYKNHNQTFLLLLLLNSITFILFFIITIFAIIIISKQVKLWFHEHHVRISILKLHGASTIYSASTILNQALISSFLAFVFASIFLYYVSYNLGVIFPIELQDIIDIKLNVGVGLLKLFLLSFSISIVTIFGVLLQYKINND